MDTCDFIDIVTMLLSYFICLRELNLKLFFIVHANYLIVYSGM